ncbi:hypothetical protein HH303_12600 [Rhodospirillaceae bacterium KN72]|uniref:Uncharacterized protein n=1 Tax=Pacificispira spongiicola TaxID=2729598 RepID=A0A7Y0E160_9PROT|nr:hypothetical protein [Pacificispira spongiicola]NMM45325.1 hypothetical protein [Pacificispira spongiicola]
MDQQTLIVILAVLVLVGYVYFRHRRGGARFSQPQLAYAYHAEPIAEAGEDLRAAFAGMTDGLPTGAVLMRFSLLNRGEGALAAATHFAAPVVITLPEGTRVLRAQAVEGHGRASHDNVAVSISGSAVTIDPFDMPSFGSVIFNIVTDGPVGNPVVSGGLKDQGDPEMLA